MFYLGGACAELYGSSICVTGFVWVLGGSMNYSYGYNHIFKATSFWVGALLPHIETNTTSLAAWIYLHFTMIIHQIKEEKQKSSSWNLKKCIIVAHHSIVLLLRIRVCFIQFHSPTRTQDTSSRLVLHSAPHKSKTYQTPCVLIIGKWFISLT